MITLPNVLTKSVANLHTDNVIFLSCKFVTFSKFEAYVFFPAWFLFCLEVNGAFLRPTMLSFGLRKLYAHQNNDLSSQTLKSTYRLWMINSNIVHCNYSWMKLKHMQLKKRLPCRAMRICIVTTFSEWIQYKKLAHNLTSVFTGEVWSYSG